MQAHSQVKARLLQYKFHQLCLTRGAAEKRTITTLRKMGIGSLGLGTATNQHKGKKQKDHKISVIKIRGVKSEKRMVKIRTWPLVLEGRKERRKAPF